MLSILLLSYINNKNPRELQFRTAEIAWYVNTRKRTTNMIEGLKLLPYEV